MVSHGRAPVTRFELLKDHVLISLHSAHLMRRADLFIEAELGQSVHRR